VRRARSKEAARAARVNRIFDDHDVLMTPMAAQPPPPIGHFEGHSGLVTFLKMGMVYPYTPIWNLLGQPAAAVPAGFASDGVPMGVQLAGRPNDEGTLLSLAAQMESERPWDERPPVS
jgi:amidase